jgi:hypothetical protein
MFIRGRLLFFGREAGREGEGEGLVYDETSDEK